VCTLIQFGKVGVYEPYAYRDKKVVGIFVRFRARFNKPTWTEYLEYSAKKINQMRLDLEEMEQSTNKIEVLGKE
jgi:hypothetical protein